MKKFFKILILAICCLVSLNARADKKKSNTGYDAFKYDVEYIKSSGDGVSTISLFSYGSTKQEAIDFSRRDAVHSVIFKGYSGNGSYQPPLVKSGTGYSDNRDFFDNFFDTGEWQKYVAGVIDGTLTTIKVKGGYKAGCVVNVNIRLLRKHLESAGIVKGLGSGF